MIIPTALASTEHHALMAAIQELEEALNDKRLGKQSHYLRAELRLNNALKRLATIAPTLASSYAEDVAEWKERTSGYARLMDLEECARIAPLLLTDPSFCLSNENDSHLGKER